MPPGQDIELVEDTTAGVDDHLSPRVRRAVFGRRVFGVVLVAFLVGTMLGVFGVRSADVTERGQQHELSVHYGRVTRPGLSTPFEFTIRHDGEFPADEPIRVTLNTDYANAFDINDFEPQPSASTADGSTITWEFDPPSGDALSVSIDGMLDPSTAPGRHRGTVAVVDQEGNVLVSARFLTWVMP